MPPLSPTSSRMPPRPPLPSPGLNPHVSGDASSPEACTLHASIVAEINRELETVDLGKRNDLAQQLMKQRVEEWIAYEYRARFARRLRVLMNLVGKSQAGLARDIGVDRRTVKRWLQATRAPDFQQIISICENCFSNANWLLGLGGDEDKPQVEVNPPLLRIVINDRKNRPPRFLPPASRKGGDRRTNRPVSG